MKTSEITVRALTRDWKATSKSLKPGQAVPVTSDGEVIGTFIKAGKIKVDWKKLVPKGDAKKGQKLIEKMLRGA